MSKKITRDMLLNYKKSEEDKKIDEILVQKFIQSSQYKNANIIGIYYPIKEEIDLLSLLMRDKKIAFPKVIGEEIKFYLYTKQTKWEINKWGIKEPKNGIIIDDEIELLVVPALAINKKGYRLGYGGGYYDRYLSKNSNISTISLINKKFILDFKEDFWDKKIDKIISI